MRNRLLIMTAALLLSIPIAALATPLLNTDDSGQWIGPSNVVISADLYDVVFQDGLLDPLPVAATAGQFGSQTARARRCTNISNCQIFIPWARNPYINRVYLV